jgi:hypothetical protein
MFCFYENYSEFLVSAQLESLYICISLDYLMTLQDFFISGLPTSGETRSRTSTMATDGQTSDQIDTEKNRLKVEPRLTRPSVTTQKSSIPKRILFFPRNIISKFLFSFDFSSSTEC